MTETTKHLHQVRTWLAGPLTKKAGQFGDKRKSLQKPEDRCLICGRRRDDKEVHHVSEGVEHAVGK